MDRYEHLGTVGEGSYGVVIKCKDKISGVFVAIKKFLETDADKAVKKIATREIKILKMLRHENLVNLIEVFRKNKRVYLVFEFIEHNLLEEIEKTINGLGEQRTKEIMYQVVRGLDFMHTNNFIHRDLKPENILINKTGLVKLCDFGFARQIAQPNETYTDYVATRWYRSPELLVGDPKYGKPVDVWSVGVLAYEVLTSKPLFPGESDLDQLFLIINSLGDLPDTMKIFFQQNQFYSNAKFPKIKNFNPLQNKLKKYSASLIKFIMEALILDPAKRATSSDLLNHEFFTQNAWTDEFMIKLKNMVSLYETSLSTSIQASTTSNNHSNNNTNTQSNTITTQTKQTTTEKTINTFINTTTTNTNTSIINNSKPVKTNNQSNHVLKINVKNHPTLTKSFDLNTSVNLNTSTNNLLNKSLNLKESVNNSNSNSKNMSEMYIIKQKNFDLNVADSKHQLQTNNSNSNLTTQNSKKLPRIELVQSHSPKNESQPTTSLKNISINFNGSNALKTSESSNFSNNSNATTNTTTTNNNNSNSNKLLKTKHDSLEFSYSKNLANSISNNSNANENNLTSNSETNLNNIELNANLVLNNNGNEANVSNPTNTNDSLTHNNLKQINLASTTNSVYILEETFKLNKKNAFGNKNINATNNRRESTNTTDLNLPHVKQIEMFPKKEKNFIYEKKTYLMQVNNKK